MRKIFQPDGFFGEILDICGPESDLPRLSDIEADLLEAKFQRDGKDMPWYVPRLTHRL